ncbi:FtsX-like permease family protein [Sphaerotilus mobilis]|uniref:Putative ABC transport system permease protein n=1 Tax=Sphaerotilus mobilis TaxID=47994 RepID=A0A4Q7LT45_9BURK|nr:ABC transporter permease [Sphaerotilus mobilis]RZS58115.1 putative ABC transport system permease protein [Sphaerotilus mobilis]
MGWQGQLRLIGQQWRHHPGRLLIAVLAIALGVALALAVQLINRSALAEFGAAVRSVNGQPDAELRPVRGTRLPESLLTTLAARPEVLLASPVIEVDTLMRTATGARTPIKVLGLDALIAPALAPDLFPRPDDDAPRLALLDPDRVFLNPAAQALLAPGRRSVVLQVGSRTVELRVGGSVSAEGPPLAVLDIAGAQEHLDRLGQLSRIDLRLAPGTDRDALQAALNIDSALPLRLAAPEDGAQRLSNLSRAYRVNLTVLALVALFTGAFLVGAVQALAVAKQVPQLALLGVLGLDAATRRRGVLAESALIGLIGAALGTGLGAALAWLALQRLGGDLGSGVFGGGTPPPLQWSTGAALLYAGLGVLAALLGGWQPARQAERIAPALALKGLGGDGQGPQRRWPGPLMLVVALALCAAPPVFGLPLAAYLAVALLLLGGIACVPAGVDAVLARLRPPRQPLALLAVERTRDQRQQATVAVAGVIASLALSVALTVMVASFRDSVSDWLTQVLPADLYARTATSSSQAESVYLEPPLVDAIGALPGVRLLQALRVVPLQLDADGPAVPLIAREIGDPAQALPLVGSLLDPSRHPGLPAVYASEGLLARQLARPGDTLSLPLPDGRSATVWVRGVWRDYARQHGSLAIDRADWIALSGDRRVNDLALWLQPDADPSDVQAGIRRVAGDTAGLLEFATPAAIRATSLAIFDRSFAVTTWLQAVAIAIGLAGIAASFSAQVLARRKEFGTLLHLGLSRREVMTLVTAEGALWSGVGALLGLLLGLAVSGVLVWLVNPQSFHWTMDLSLPAGRLAALSGAVVLAGSVTAWLSARMAAGRDLGDMVRAVKEDW